jgi:hypothetical protein
VDFVWVCAGFETVCVDFVCVWTDFEVVWAEFNPQKNIKIKTVVTAIIGFAFFMSIFFKLLVN